MYLPEPGYKRIFVVLLYVVLGFAALLLSWKYLFIVLIPFSIAWILAYFLQKPIFFLNKKMKIPKKLSAIVLILLIISAVSGLLFFVFDKLFDELSSLYEFAKNNSKEISASLTQTIEKIEKALNKFPFAKFFEIDNFGEQIKETLTKSLLQMATGAVEKIPSFLTNVISLFPKLFIFIIILIFSAFYLTFDFAEINQFFLLQFNKKVNTFMVEFKAIFFNVITKFVKAYLFMFIITFAVMFLGFALMRLKFALIIALIVAVVDLLPILGSGTILIPWSVLSLVSGNYALALELIVLYLAITFIRNSLLPRIIGDFIGLHPLASLLSMFLGYAIMGIAGMFIFPIVLIILKTMNDDNTISLWKKMPKEEK